MKNLFVVFMFFFFLQVHAIEQKNEISKVELQWVLCEASAEKLFSKLRMQTPDVKDRNVFYLETRNLDLFGYGSIIRTRISKGTAKTAVKIKNFKEQDIPWEFLKQDEFKCELDAYPGHEGIGCSVFYSPTDNDTFISKRQKEFIEMQTQFNKWNDLTQWGPVQSQEWQWQEPSLRLDLTVEQINSGSIYQSIELSVRVAILDKAKTTNVIDNWLEKNKISLCTEQNGQTGKLLQLLTRSQN